MRNAVRAALSVALLARPCVCALVAVEPRKLLRLRNSVYGSEALLLFGREDSTGTLLPTLLTFDQGSALEEALGAGSSAAAGPFGAINLAGKLLARTEFFEAAARRRIGAWEMAQKAQGANGLAEAMVSHLSACGLEPRSVRLGTADEEREVSTVGMRDMGANTPAAPSSVRLTAQLPATLLCEDGAAQVLGVPLGGAADAVILARHAAMRGSSLPLLVAPSLWELRAVAPDKLPEVTAEQDCTLDGCEPV